MDKQIIKAVIGEKQQQIVEDGITIQAIPVWKWLVMNSWTNKSHTECQQTALQNNKQINVSSV